MIRKTCPLPPARWLIDQHGPSNPAAARIAWRMAFPAAMLAEQACWSPIGRRFPDDGALRASSDGLCPAKSTCNHRQSRLEGAAAPSRPGSADWLVPPAERPAPEPLEA